MARSARRRMILHAASNFNAHSVNRTISSGSLVFRTIIRSIFSLMLLATTSRRSRFSLRSLVLSVAVVVAVVSLAVVFAVASSRVARSIIRASITEFARITARITVNVRAASVGIARNAASSLLSKICVIFRKCLSTEHRRIENHSTSTCFGRILVCCRFIHKLGPSSFSSAKIVPQFRYTLRKVHLDTPIVNQAIVHLKIRILACFLSFKLNEPVAERIPRFLVFDYICLALAKTGEDQVQVTAPSHFVQLADKQNMVGRFHIRIWQITDHFEDFRARFGVFLFQFLFSDFCILRNFFPVA
mmetsp:Transcript_18843/g.47356  ORF Transcript_18843/g.47356 Transcript_18843/m.47356 type:complete len:302 (-) Transcript_18843:727-1632(-)